MCLPCLHDGRWMRRKGSRLRRQGIEWLDFPLMPMPHVVLQAGGAMSELFAGIQSDSKAVMCKKQSHPISQNSLAR